MWFILHLCIYFFQLCNDVYTVGYVNSLKQDIFFRCWLYICETHNSDIRSFLLINSIPEKLFSLNLFHYSVSFFPTWGISLHLFSCNMDEAKIKTKWHSMHSDLSDETYNSAEMVQLGVVKLNLNLCHQYFLRLSEVGPTPYTLHLFYRLQKSACLHSFFVVVFFHFVFCCDKVNVTFMLCIFLFCFVIVWWPFWTVLFNLVLLVWVFHFSSKVKLCRRFPDSSVIRTPGCHFRGHEFDLWSGN